MAISNDQKIDFLWKKVGYGAAKRDINSVLNATQEGVASPLLIRGDKLLTQADQIPSSMPASSGGVVTVYPTTNPIEVSSFDTSARDNRAWNTGVTDWIPPEFGSTYSVKVYIHTSGDASNAAANGTRVFAAGSGNNDEYFFDYQAGLLNFIGTNLPNGVSFSGKSVYISGAYYSGSRSVVSSGTAVSFSSLNVTGITTTETLKIGTGITATSGVLTATTLATGDVGVGVRISSNTISGPANLIIDPAAVGDNTGSLRIKGDLYVDGTQFIVNSETVTLADFVVGIASTATTDSLADGAGIQIGPDNTLKYDHTNTALKSSENFNIASSKTYKIDGTDVLSNTTLGSGVTNSSLTSVGTLESLNVGAAITASGGIVTATSFVGDGSNITGIALTQLSDLNASNIGVAATDYLLIYDPASSGFKFVNPKTYFGINADSNPDPLIEDYGTF